MVRYWFAWMPAVLVFGTLVILTSPYLALIVLLGILLGTIVAVVALVRATALALYRLPRRLLRAHVGSRGETAPNPREPDTTQGPADELSDLVLGPYAGTP